MGVDVQTGREYLRVSYDRSGRERSLTEQQDDNRASWPELVFNDETYSDLSISASRYSTKARGGYGRLVEDLRSGRFGADVLVLWEASRGSRRVGEWVELIELCEARQVLFAVTMERRTYDPANPRDRRSLLEDAVDSEYESAKMSARIKRAVVANAQAGRPAGRVPFGYRRVHDERTGRLVGQEIVLDEAVVVREMFERMTQGHSLKGIAEDFVARGIGRRDGGYFRKEHIRTMLRNPLYIGKKVYVPGRRGGHTTAVEMRREDAVVVDAVWPALVDESTWWQVQSILEDPARSAQRPGRGWRPGRAKHLLSLIVRCDVCDGPTVSEHRKGHPRRMYKCQRGHVRVDAEELDTLASKAMLAYLGRADTYEGALAVEKDGDDLESARAETGRVRAELDDLYDQVGKGAVSASLAARSEPAILERLRRAEAAEAELATPSRLRGLIEPGPDVAKRWEAAPISTRRELARMLLAPDVMGELRIAKSPHRGHPRVPAHERVVWRLDDTEPDN